MATANLNKSEDFMTNTTTASKYLPRRPRIIINWNPTFQTSLLKISKGFFLDLQLFFSGTKKNFQEQLLFRFFMYCKAKKKFRSNPKNYEICFLKIYFLKKVWKGGFQLMLILGLLGMYFDAAVVFVTNSCGHTVKWYE